MFVDVSWKLDRARQRVHKLGEIVHGIDASMPFMGNSVAFGDPGWTTGASLDLENQAAVADAVQVEIQSRARYVEATGKATWQWRLDTRESGRGISHSRSRPIVSDVSVMGQLAPLASPVLKMRNGIRQRPFAPITD